MLNAVIPACPYFGGKVTSACIAAMLAEGLDVTEAFIGAEAGEVRGVLAILPIRMWKPSMVEIWTC